MIGLESSEGAVRGVKNMWGSVHDSSSATADSTKETSPTGGHKWVNI
jgi:hypothetical protein